MLRTHKFALEARTGDVKIGLGRPPDHPEDGQARVSANMQVLGPGERAYQLSEHQGLCLPRPHVRVRGERALSPAEDEPGEATEECAGRAHGRWGLAGPRLHN